MSNDPAPCGECKVAFPRHEDWCGMNPNPKSAGGQARARYELEHTAQKAAGRGGFFGKPATEWNDYASYVQYAGYHVRDAAALLRVASPPPDYA